MNGKSQNEADLEEKEMAKGEQLLTLEIVAERLAVSRKMVFDWVRAGKIPGVKMGRLWRVKESALDEFIDSLETVKPGEDRRCSDRGDDPEGVSG
jgi:excisionase family DNA binding protein